MRKILYKSIKIRHLLFLIFLLFLPLPKVEHLTIGYPIEIVDLAPWGLFDFSIFSLIINIIAIAILYVIFLKLKNKSWYRRLRIPILILVTITVYSGAASVLFLVALSYPLNHHIYLTLSLTTLVLLHSPVIIYFWLGGVFFEKLPLSIGIQTLFTFNVLFYMLIWLGIEFITIRIKKRTKNNNTKKLSKK